MYSNKVGINKKINKKVLNFGIEVPALFALVNYWIFKVPFNWIELLVVVIITVNTIVIYGKKQDYLDTGVYFPILYFILFWIGDFDFGFYPAVPQKMWVLYLLGLLGFYLGTAIVKVTKISVPIIKKADFLRPNVRNVFILIYGVCLLSKIVMYMQGGIPLFENNIDASRQVIAESFSILKVIATAHTILAVFFFYDIVVRKKAQKRIPWINVLIIICSFGLAIIDVSRLLIIQMFLPMVLIYILKVHRIKLKNLLIILFLTLVFIGANKFIRNILDNPEYLSYIVANRDTNMFENVMLSSFTSFRVGIDDLRQLIEVVPSEHSYTYGQMFANSILSVLPGKQVVIGYYAAELLGMSFDGIGAATTILGMFYLDGGIMMIFVGMMLFGMFIQYFYKKYISHNNITIYSLIAVYILYYAINCLRTNVMPTIEPLLFMFYYAVFSYMAKRIK